MTTTVIIKAHCAPTKEVQIQVKNGDSTITTVLQDGETTERVVCDDLSVTVMEKDKTVRQKGP